jgi:hypothetical protein
MKELWPVMQSVLSALAVPVFQLSQNVFEEGWFRTNFLTPTGVKK